MSTDLSNRTALKLHTHQALERKCTARDSPYSRVIAIGGVGSGKTLTIARWMIDRGQWDTSQFHGLFAWSGPQLQTAILGEVLPWLELAGIDSVWNCRPPKEWFERWRLQGIKTPPRLKKYTNYLILSTGLHVYCGTIANRSYRAVKGMKFGSVVIEEITSGPTQEAIRYIEERVRCGVRERCKTEHRHIKILHGNPPDEDSHWLYEWLAKLEKEAAKAIGAPVPDNPDQYPLLLRGKGKTIYIPSRTGDNIQNLPEDYVEDIAASVDEETAKRVLDGVLTRRKSGRAYNKYDEENEHPIKYDPTRELYLCFDFNYNPTVAVLAQPLRPGEYPVYPAGSEDDGSLRVGVFGEFFHVGGMDVYDLAEALASGARASNGYLPSSWKGVAQHRARVKVFGDATGGARKTIMGSNPWIVVNDVLRGVAKYGYAVDVPDHNPLQQLRVRSLNAMLCNSAGVRRLFVDPNVTEFKTDLAVVQLKADGTILKPGGPRAGSRFWLRTHESDAVGYMADRLAPLGRVKKDAAGSRTRVVRSDGGRFKHPRLS